MIFVRICDHQPAERGAGPEAESSDWCVGSGRVQRSGTSHSQHRNGDGKILFTIMLQCLNILVSH